MDDHFWLSQTGGASARNLPVRLRPTATRRPIDANFYICQYFGQRPTNGYNTVVMMQWIEIQPDVCNDRPVLRGTRIAAQSVLEAMAAGDSIDDVLQSYPSLRREHVRACFEFAARLMRYRSTGDRMVRKAF